MELLSIEARRLQSQGAQWQWYQLVSSMVAGLDVIDVGAGDGYGIDFLRRGNPKSVVGIDPLPHALAGKPVTVLGTAVGEIGDKAFDAVVAMDVIEHVEDDIGFVLQLERVARCFVFLSTPNWNHWRAANPFHVREYTPQELAELLGARKCRVWSCDIQSRIQEIERLDQAECSFGVRWELGGSS